MKLPRTHKTSLRGLAAAAAVTGIATLAVTAAGPALASGPALAGAPASPADRGHLVSVTPLGTLPTPAAVRAELTADGFSAAPARYGVRSYRLVYRTVDAHGRPATASGLMVLPVS
ncbi:MAG TPA: hypothetical protein VGN41_18900, partial [Streptosporangiaceae bacterium]